MDPEVLLEQLRNGAQSGRKVKSLELVHAVCKEQIQRGSIDFSIATVGSITKAKGGPAAQSIRNKSGEDYRAIIACWAKHAVDRSGSKPGKGDSPLSTVLQKIEDPAVRAVMGAVIAQNKKLVGEVNLLKSNSNVVIDQRRFVSAVHIEDEICAPVPSLNAFTESEVYALRHAISKELLEQEGWSIDGAGRILNSRGRVVFKPGFATAIAKIVES